MGSNPRSQSEASKPTVESCWHRRVYSGGICMSFSTELLEARLEAKPPAVPSMDLFTDITFRYSRSGRPYIQMFEPLTNRAAYISYLKISYVLHLLLDAGLSEAELMVDTTKPRIISGFQILCIGFW